MKTWILKNTKRLITNDLFQIAILWVFIGYEIYKLTN